MRSEQALEFVEKLVFSHTGEHLDKAARLILHDLWENDRLTYQGIADNRGYTEAYLKEVGAKLWQLLSELVGEKVSKSNFSRVIESAWKNGEDLTITGNNGKNQELDINFVGRDRQITDLHNLVTQGTKIIFIQGKGGVGKTTLARRYFKTHKYDFLDLWMAKESQNIVSVESVVEEWLRGDFNEEPGREFGINLDRLRRKLRNGNGKKIGVLIDNLESALDKNGRIIDPHRAYIELLRVLADPTLNSVTLITSREPIYESGIDISFYPLKGLDESAWRQFFQSRSINCNYDAVGQMWQAFGGNAKAMQIISSVIIKDFESNADTYWRENRNDLLIERELEDLVTSQFNRLQQLDIAAYQLLCRLGCYRYQDITHVSIQGLSCLLWDVPEQQHKRVIKSLVDRYLVESRKGKYWLHPVIREESINRLKQIGEWQIANSKAAEFWNASVTRITEPQDALTALEAYHHYMEIEEFEQAANVIVCSRNNKWDQNISLGVLFNRFGLLETLISIITPLVNKLSSAYYLSTLYNMLGRAYHQLGDISSAIKSHQRASEIAEINSILQEKISGDFNLGLCYIDLWEVEKARNVFQAVKNLVKADQHYYQYVVYSLCCLAYLYSELGIREEALTMLKEAEAGISSPELTSWGIGTTLLFRSLAYKNLGYIDTSFEICQPAIDHCEKKQFTFLKARAISCLASLYRERGEFAIAIENHQHAITIMHKVSDKCNLAKAFYQLGLTYQRMGNIDKSKESFNQAIILFNEMPAPKQVEKVQSAMKHFPQ
ncbi:MAG TPA: tetratricopeptide repeat protein [Nostocaceae cyanobacterium]|nr:tetratricopeptide repeat protein [Nostocaceae cyanobacterium]